MKKSTAIFAVLCLFALVFMGIAGCDRPNALEYMNKGEKYRRNKQPDKAIEYLSNAISMGNLGNDDLSNAYYCRGNAYVMKESYDNAMEDFNKALELNPKNWFAYALRGFVYTKKNLLDKALADLNRAIELNPKDAVAYIFRSHIYVEKKLYDRTIEDLSRAIELDPKNEYAYCFRGTAYMQNKLYDRAIGDLNRAIELDPSDVVAHTFRGLAYAKKRLYDRAIENYNEAIKLNPEDSSIYYNKACSYSLMNNTTDACKWLNVAIEKGYNDWRHIKSDADLNNIRNSACYKKIMAWK